MSASSGAHDFFAGAIAPWRGLAFLWARPRSWPNALAPAVCAVASLIVVTLALGHVFLNWMDGRGPHPFLGAGAFVIEVIVAHLAAFVVAFFAAFPLAVSLASPSLERLVRAFDTEAGVAPYPRVGWLKGALRSLRVTLLGLALGAPIAVLLGLLDLLAPIAAIVTTPIAALVTAAVVAWDLLDVPFAFRAMGVRDRMQWMRDRAPLVTGFGLSASLFFVVPLLGLVLLPAGVIGAAMIVAESERKDALARSPT